MCRVRRTCGRGLNVAVPALFIVGVGTLLYGLVPRLAVPVLYALILWSFLIQIIGSIITINHWLLDFRRARRPTASFPITRPSMRGRRDWPVLIEPWPPLS